MRHTPAVQALLIQIAASGLVLFAAYGLPLVVNFQLTVAAAALLQGGSAMLIARLCRMAWWWLPIHFFFPLAVVVVHVVGLPSWLFLVLFIGLASLYWSTFRTQVPFYPSRYPVWNAVETLLPAKPLRFIDIGSGGGGLILYLAQKRPDSDFAGIEVAPLPWLVSVLRGRMQYSKAAFMRGDYEGVNFAEYDVVFAFLSPAAMPSVWQKAVNEMRPGCLLLSYEFSISQKAPDVVRHPVVGGPLLYGWYIGDR